MKHILISVLFIISFIQLKANDTDSILRIQPNIQLPKDSLESKNLISSLNGFLIAARGSNEENKWVLESEKLETYILLDEFHDVEKSTRHSDEYYFKPYLNNVIRLDSNTYHIKVSYIGAREDEAQFRASFSILAHRDNNGFKFSSMLKKQTNEWKMEKIGTITFHFREKLDHAHARSYVDHITLFDAKLGLKESKTEIYCCETMLEAGHQIGMDYKSDYNGWNSTVFSVTSGNVRLVLFANNNASFETFDSHDLWHERLSLVVSRREVNKPVDEGCAYLYGGSWGYTWEEIYAEFKKQIVNQENHNWEEMKETPQYFMTGPYKNSADYIVNALLVDLIEKKHGFAGVWKLLKVGPYEKGNEAYYQVLESLTGITRENYNQQIEKLIKEKG